MARQLTKKKTDKTVKKPPKIKRSKKASASAAIDLDARTKEYKRLTMRGADNIRQALKILEDGADLIDALDQLHFASGKLRAARELRIDIIISQSYMEP